MKVVDLPSQVARTDRFQKGAQSNHSVSCGGRYVTYLRDGSLWAYDVALEHERHVGAASSYDAGRGTTAVLLRKKELVVADIVAGCIDRPPVANVEAARVDPSGHTVAFVRDRALWLIGADGRGERLLAAADGANVRWGLSEPITGRSMGRTDGLWWSPDGTRLLAARVDDSQVETRYLTDLADPTAPPTATRYPAVGTPTADVRLYLLTLDGDRLEVRWDRDRFEYLVRVLWSHEQPLITIQTRDQRCVQILAVDPDSGETSLVREVTDPDFVGVPARTPEQMADGRLVWIERDQTCDTYRLIVGDEAVSPPGLQVAELRSISAGTVTFLGQTDPTETHLYVWDGDIRRLTTEPGVHTGLVVDGTTVIDSRTLTGHTVTVNGQPLKSTEEEPALVPRVSLVRTGSRDLRTAVFRPSWHEPGSSRLPVLLTPYSGPGLQLAQKYLAPANVISQWFAEHGFIVLSTDGRGTPGRGPAFDRATVGDILAPVIEDQVDALHAIAAQAGDLDLDRVAIRGWSYGGYLAIGALLHRPDIFHAAIGGAAVADQRWYDAYWKERFLGHPAEHPDAYRRTSLLPYADKLRRPLMMIHGLADTNVWAAHSIRLSGAFNALGKPHELVLLPGEGHRPSNTRTIEALLHRELAFLHKTFRPSIDIATSGAGQ
ncbi:prolyl oligopeptidase family serine peptidase [Kribbella sp. NPDC051586]|uniref:S9 family peptidase n=1 Tax=Kribbella sp. NPDC051586 TaxID=3364118 RepID=UPI0037BB230F